MVLNPADRPEPDGAAPKPYRLLSEVLAHYPGVREEHLRSLQKLGLIARPSDNAGERRIAFTDLAVIRHVYTSLQEGAAFKAVLRALLASRDGQLALDFRLDTQPARIIALRTPANAAGRTVQLSHTGKPNQVTDELAEEYFRLASTLDDGSTANQPRAAVAYRRALESDPTLVPALINLANIHYANDQLIEALALYERAAGLDPTVFEGHFNLGNIHHDLGRYDDAERHYRRALELNPAHPETHLYLAVAMEKAGRSDAARPHWKAYQNLAPDGEWADLAREFSD